MNFDEMKDKAMNAAKDHKDQVGEGMDKVAEAAKDKFGHGDQVDQAKDKAKDFLSGGE